MIIDHVPGKISSTSIWNQLSGFEFVLFVILVNHIPGPFFYDLAFDPLHLVCNIFFFRDFCRWIEYHYSIVLRFSSPGIFGSE